MTQVKPKQTLLIVEDDTGFSSQLRWHFDQYNVVLAEDRPSAIAAVRQHEPAVVLQDLGLPPDEEGVEEGFKCVQEIMRLAPSTKIIVITGNHDYENAVRAVALGAYDFYQKADQCRHAESDRRTRVQHLQLEQQNRRLSEQRASPLVWRDRE